MLRGLRSDLGGVEGRIAGCDGLISFATKADGLSTRRATWLAECLMAPDRRVVTLIRPQLTVARQRRTFTGFAIVLDHPGYRAPGEG
jgi:hypothetical protein